MKAQNYFYTYIIYLLLDYVYYYYCWIFVYRDVLNVFLEFRWFVTIQFGFVNISGNILDFSRPLITYKSSTRMFRRTQKNRVCKISDSRAGREKILGNHKRKQIEFLYISDGYPAAIFVSSVARVHSTILKHDFKTTYA